MKALCASRWSLLARSALLAWLVGFGGGYAAAASPVAIIKQPLWAEPSVFFAGDRVEIFVPVWNASEDTREAEVAVLIDEYGCRDHNRGACALGEARSREFYGPRKKGEYTLTARIVQVARKTIIGETPLPIPKDDEAATPPIALVVDRDTDDDRVGDNQDHGRRQ
ncbi:MAG: hypothetical protein KatS3mg099_191 [Candidatus Parcubacteria bacterium]|nr:MAG: hypothetical protein KatS3mg099_191 [Candidatus Parcubacteria bacterium]